MAFRIVRLAHARCEHHFLRLARLPGDHGTRRTGSTPPAASEPPRIARPAACRSSRGNGQRTGECAQLISATSVRVGRLETLRSSSSRRPDSLGAGSASGSAPGLVLPAAHLPTSASPSTSLPAATRSPPRRVREHPLRRPGAPPSAAWPKCAITSASIRSVLASLPRERAKSRTCRGLTTAIGNPAAPKVANPMPIITR